MVEQYARTLEKLMEGRCSIKRAAAQQAENGSTFMRYEIIAREVPCRLSRRTEKRESIRQNLPAQESQQQMRLFLPSGTDIRLQDRVSVTQNGCTGEYYAGPPFAYATHIEVPLWRKEEA